MQITLTWGDILIELLILLVGTALIAIFGKYILPRLIALLIWLSDRWVALNDRRAEIKSAQLQEKLKKYNDDVADSTHFMCRILFKVVFLLLLYDNGDISHWVCITYGNCNNSQVCGKPKSWL